MANFFSWNESCKKKKKKYAELTHSLDTLSNVQSDRLGLKNLKRIFMFLPISHKE